ncbi:hypothetical protein RUM44_007488 [Polyplax serrata]|uniref:Tubulin-specific chaperone E n=1 Tax=Polyplax serrata TaxID=468196 RepID=A0ABR1B0Y8_POLSC
MPDFKNLRVVLLRDFLVNGAGPPLGLLRLCPSIQELDLSKTLLDSWGTVAQITNQLKNLTILNLSENRLKLTEDIDSEAFKTIEHIILGKLMYSWSEILKCSELFLNIKALQVQYNKIDIIEAPSEKLFRNLLMLDLEGNPITSWEEINNLGGLHTLETLNVSCCGLKGVLFPNSTSPLNLFKNLKNLMLTGNEIDNWSSISELDKLQSLYDLRFKDNPILVKENVETNHQLITAKIGKLQVLNGQQVLRDERKGAEIDYLKRFGTTWLALKTEDERKKFNAIHPRYMQLVAKYGPPEENEVKEMPTSLKSQLIQIEISSSEKTFSKKVPYNMSVQKLSGLIQRLFNTGSTIPHLSCIHAERTDGLAVPLEDYLKDLNFYSIENGDKISVNW